MRAWSIILVLLISVNFVFAKEELKQGDVMYVKADENLRLSPNGTIITKLPEATKVTVLGEQSGWVAVQVVGWIWKPSLVASKEQILGYTMNALHILVETQAEADNIKAELNKGKDFAELAKLKSKGPNAERGGDLGVINKGDLLPELDEALRKLKVGETSGVIKSELGYHIFKRLK